MENKTLEIELEKNEEKLICRLTGWLDPNTSPELISKLNLKGVKELVFDMSKVEYVFSAGLRAFLILQKMMDNQDGTLKLINVSDSIRSIFEYTGFESMLEPKE